MIDGSLVRQIFDSIPDAIYFKDRQGQLILVNQAHARGLGLRPEDVVGNTDFDYFPDEQARQMTADDRRVMRTGKPLVDILEQTTRPDGTSHFVSTTKLPRVNKRGKVIGIMGITRDVTSRTRFERDRYRVLFETSQNCIYITTREGQWVDINEAGVKLFGYRNKRQLLKTPVINIYADSAERLKFKKIIEKQDSVKNYELELRKKNGAAIQGIVSAAVRRDENGRILGYQGTILDITERKKAERERETLLERLNQRFRELSCLYGIEQIRRKESSFLDKQMEEVLRLLKPSFRNPGQTHCRIVYEGRVFRSEKFRRSKILFSVPIIVKNKKAGNLEIFYSSRVRRDDLLSKEERGFIVAVAKRLGLFIERKVVDEELQNTLRELKDIKWALDASAIVAITDAKGRIIYVNDKFCEISGYRREELIGEDHRLINSGLHAREHFRDLWQTISSGRIWKGEICNHAKFGRLYWVDTTIIPFLNEKGKPYQYVSIRYEITRRKMMEEAMKKLPQRIIQAQEKERESISREIHDDLGQSLVVLKMLIQSSLPRGGSGPGRNQQEYQKVIACVDGVIEKTRALAAGLRPSALEVLGLSSALEALVEHFSERGGLKIMYKPVSLENLQFRGEIINLYRIVQEALTNIVRHARAVKAEIVMRRRRGRLLITVKDNGIGLMMGRSPEVRMSRSGLGLSTMEERARLLDGTLRIHSSPGQGTLLEIDIPVLKEA